MSVCTYGKTMVFYSGGCRFCRWVARQLHKWDPEIGLCPFRDDDAEIYLWDVPMEERKLHWWIVSRRGGRYKGNHGGLAVLLREFKWTKPLGWIIHGLGMDFVVDSIDDAVNRNRPTLAAWVSDGPAPKRLFPVETERV